MDLLEAILNELPRSHQNRMACLEYFREHRQSIRENSQLTNEMINRLDRRLEKISSTMDL
jgi:septation ring formation regulator EzrA